MRETAGGIIGSIGLIGLVVSMVALVRLLLGRTGVAFLSTRQLAGWAIAVTFGLTMIGGAIIPKEADDAVTTLDGEGSSSTFAPVTTASSVVRSTTTVKATTTTARPAPTTTKKATTTTVKKRATTTTKKPVVEAERGGDSRNPGKVYPGRPDIQKDDHERLVGEEPVRFAGWSVYVTASEIVRRPSSINTGTYLRVHVRLLNRDEDQQFWSKSDWSLIYPTGEVYSPAIVPSDDPLGISGGLVHGGVAEGDIWFNVDDQRGDFYVTWEPSGELSHQGRGVWRLTH